MNITEIFYSLQGEGRLTGVPSVFIRVAGCPLRCAWCDTKYAWENSAGEDLSVEEILSRVDALLSTPSFAFSSTQNLELRTQSSFIVVTGGEPMTNQHLPILLTKLAEVGHHITVETSGIAFIPDLPVDLMSISPKLSNAQGGVDSSLSKRYLKQLITHYDYQLKFVIDTEDDIAEVMAVIDSLSKIDPQKVLLMPQAKTRDELIAKSPMVAELCTRYGYTFCSRLHILLWNTQRGR
jgi:7-carboxy-7-deazaguanine synthase